VGVVGLDRRHPGTLDVLGRVEVGLADLEVDDVPALRLELACACQDLEGAFARKPGHRRRRADRVDQHNLDPFGSKA